MLGNPPYVKLQNLMKVDPDVVAYMRRSAETTPMQSARTGNFDLYLPFIEKGLRLLAPGGRMAYIAPSLWAVNQYGEGLARLVRRGRHLDRWVDFKAHQIFEDVITYTALQFFTREPLESCASPPRRTAKWRTSTGPMPNSPYLTTRIPETGEWLMATGAERALIERLARDCLRLDDPTLTSGIIVGIQTSADQIYHLERSEPIATGARPKGGAVPYEVEIEDAIMKPIVSGPEAKRYEEPETDTYLLFPYERDARGTMRLIHCGTWKALPEGVGAFASLGEGTPKTELNAFDNENWIAGATMSRISTSRIFAKLIVPQTCSAYEMQSRLEGRYCLDNVDVGGVLAATERVKLSFLMARSEWPVCRLCIPHHREAVNKTTGQPTSNS